MTFGRDDPPVILLKAQLHLSSNLSKNSRRSGSSLGEGANFSPSSRACFWYVVKEWLERFRIDPCRLEGLVSSLVVVEPVAKDGERVGKGGRGGGGGGVGGGGG